MKITKKTLTIIDNVKSANINKINEINCDILGWYEDYKINNHFKDILSLTNFVEQNSELLKEEYFNLLNEIENEIVKENLIYNKFNFWNLSPLVENSNFGKTKEINDVIRLLAIKLIIEKNNINHIIYAGKDPKINFILMQLSKYLKFNYKSINFFFHHNLKRKLIIFYNFKNFFFGFLYLFYYYLKRLPLITGIPKIDKNHKLIFFSYFMNIDVDKEKNTYKNNYWGNLNNKVLSTNNLKSTWLHIYVPHSKISSALKARSIIDNMNLISKYEKHYFVESFLNIKIIFKSIYIWINLIPKIIFINKKLFSNKKKFIFFNILEKNLNRYFYGTGFALDILFHNLFLSINLKNYKSCFYLMENQSWEKSLLHNWKINNFNNICGVAHSTIRFWDLRYFYFQNKFKSTYQKPNYIIANGPYSHNLLNTINNDFTKIITLETLRYDYLFNLKKIKKNGFFKIIILGDIIKEETINVINFLNSFNGKIKKNVIFYLKPHPATKINLNKYKNLSIKITNKDIQQLIYDTDLIFSSPMTSASVEFYFSGINIAYLLYGKNFNLSPIRNFNGIHLITKESDFIDLVENFQNLKTNKAEITDYFYNDKNLKRWGEFILKNVK